MPYGSNPWMDLSSETSGINQSMANVALAQRQAQYMAQQNAAKMALEQARLQIERDAEARAGRVSEAQIPMYNAETERYKTEIKKYGTENEMARQTMDTQQRLGRLRGYSGAPDIMSMVQDPFSGPQMMGDLRAAHVVPEGQFQLNQQQLMQALQAALGGQTYQQGMGTAAAAERATEPYQVGPNQNLVDPFSRQSIYTAPPAAPNPETMRHNLAMEGFKQTPEQQLTLAQMRAAANAVGRPNPITGRVDIDTLNEILTGAENKFMGRTNAPSGGVPHPFQRKVGQRVTTQKGTFEWDGTEWQPVSQ